MNKFIKALMCLFTVIATSCTSLPDNVRKLDVQIQSLTIANQNNVEGFLLEYSVKHTSSKAMPVDIIKVDIDKLNDLPEWFDNLLHEYQDITGYSDNRINKLCILLNRQINKLKKLIEND